MRLIFFCSIITAAYYYPNIIIAQELPAPIDYTTTISGDPTHQGATTSLQLAVILGSSIPLTIIAIMAAAIFTVSVVAVCKYRSKFKVTAVIQDHELVEMGAGEEEHLYDEVGCNEVGYNLLTSDTYKITVPDENEGKTGKNIEVSNMAECRDTAMRKKVDCNKQTATCCHNGTGDQERRDTKSSTFLGNDQHFNEDSSDMECFMSGDDLELTPYVVQNNDAYGVKLEGVQYNGYENVMEFI